MKNFKAFLLVLLVLAPVSVFATIVGDSNTSRNEREGTSQAVNLDAISQTILAGQNEVTDYWIVDLEQTGTLNITFASTTLGFLHLGNSDFTGMYAENISESGIFAMDLYAGKHTFLVEGQPGPDFEILGLENGGIYTVSALFPASQTPTPTELSMGTAMLGLLTVSRRNKAKS